MITLTMNNGEKLALKEVSKILGISYSALYGYVKEGITTEGGAITKRYDTKQVRHKARTIFNTSKGKMTAHEVLEIHPHKERMNLSMVLNRMYVNGPEDPSLWDDRKSGGTTKIVSQREIVAVPEPLDGVCRVDKDFHRNDHCTGDTLRDKCKRYKVCADSRAYTGKHNKYYKKDGSCFELPKEY